MELLSVRIDPKLLADGDAELLEDLVTAAVNQGLTKAREAAAAVDRSTRRRPADPRASPACSAPGSGGGLIRWPGPPARRGPPDRRLRPPARARGQVGRAAGLPPPQGPGRGGPGPRRGDPRGQGERPLLPRPASTSTEADQPLCAICRDPRRDPGLICVVEQSRDLLALEKSGTFGGVYHVLLGRLAPLQGVGPEQLTVDALERRVRAGGVRELIMATNPTLEGDGTALLVANRLADTGVADHPAGPRAWPRAASWNSPTKRCWPTRSTAASGFEPGRRLRAVARFAA